MKTIVRTIIIGALLALLAVAALENGFCGALWAARWRNWVHGETPATASYPAVSAGNPAVPELQQQLTALKQQMVKKDAEIASLERALREFEGFRRALPEISLKTARVCGHFGDEVLLDRGAEAGIQIGQALAQGGIIAGTVAQLQPHCGVAILTNNPGSLIPARAAKSRDVCVVRGRGGQNAVVVFYANQTATSPGEKILTSGLLGKIPAGLIIGTVADYPQAAPGGTMEAPLHLEADFPALENVLVLSPLKPLPERPEKHNHKNP